MAAVTQTVPNFLGGVSKQTDIKKQPGQVRNCINAYPDPTFGLMKRPGFKFIKNIYKPLSGTDPELKDGKWFFIKRDNLETYIGCILDKGNSSHASEPIRIWNKEGTKCEVDFESSPADAKLYLDTTRDNYDVLTVQDTSIITNKTREVEAKAAPTDYVSKSYGTVRLKNIAYSCNYQIKIKIGDTYYGTDYSSSVKTIKDVSAADASRVEDTYLNVASTASADGTGATFNIVVSSSGACTVSIESVGTGYAVDEVITIPNASLGGGADLTFKVSEINSHLTDELAAFYTTINAESLSSPNSVTNPKDEQYNTTDRILNELKTDLAAVTLPTNHALTITQLPASLELVLKNTSTDTNVAFELTTSDSQGGIHIDSFNEQVRTQADLPAESTDGRLTKVVALGGESDTFWLKFFPDSGTSGKGNWEETVDPSVSQGMKAETLPHELYNVHANKFIFRQPKEADGTTLAWKGRVVGDTITNSNPSFVGATIQQAFYHNNRLGFLTKDNVSMSKVNGFFNFYFTSALTATDADPIDINCSSIRPAVLHAVIPTAQGLILFSKNQQFIMFSDAEILTPSSAVIRGISNYEMDSTIDPVDVGTTINFVSKTPSYTRIFGMQTRGSEESPMVIDIGKVVSEWIPDTVNSLLSSPQNSLIALYGDNRSAYEGDNNMYIFKTYSVGDKMLMQAWFNWELPGNIQHASIDSDTMWSVVETSGVYSLISASLTQTPEETIMTTADGKQINPHMDMYTAATNGGGAITGASISTGTGTDASRTLGTYSISNATSDATDSTGVQSDWKVVISSGGVAAITMLDGGKGYAATDTITIAGSTFGAGADLVIDVDTVASPAEKKVVYDSAGNFSKCYIPYADLTNLNPVILIAGNASADFAGVTEYGFTVSPTRPDEVVTDGTETYFKVKGKDLSAQADNVYVGYQYNYDVELPKTYYKLTPDGSQYDYTAALTIARMKFAVGLSSVVGFKVKSKGYRGELKEYVGGGDSDTDVGVASPTDTRPGKSVFTVPFPLKTENGIVVKVDGAKQDINTAYTVTTTDAQATVTFLSGHVPLKERTVANVTKPAQKIEITTDTWYDVQPTQEAGQYLADDVPLIEESIFTIPVHQRSDNFNLRVFSNSPFPVSLTSMMWEGQYSPRFYRRT